MSAPLRQLAATGWAFRAQVEREAALRFERLAAAVSSFDGDSPVVALLWSAAQDERRHASLCAELARSFGATVSPVWPSEAPSVAPPSLSTRAATLYEVVAASCITETESLATLTTLLPRTRGDVERVLRDIARDEVRHAQLGWAHLVRERFAVDTVFLADAVPHMLAGTVDDALFAQPKDPLHDDEGLYDYGLLPHSAKREVFTRALEEVVFPGLEHGGVSTAPAREWLAQRLESGAVS